MAKLNKVYEFNTGRHYGENKQPIEWMIVRVPIEEITPFRYKVLFYDKARGIPGIIPCLVNNIEDLINDDWVLGQYDAYQFTTDMNVITLLNEAKKVI